MGAAPDPSLRRVETEELLRRAAAEVDQESDVRWQCLYELHHRAEESTLAAALELAYSDDEHRRCLGIDVLAQLGYEERFIEERLDALLRLAAEPQSDDVVEAIVYGLGTWLTRVVCPLWPRRRITPVRMCVSRLHAVCPT